MVKKSLLSVILIMLLLSCKTAKIITDDAINEKLSSKAIIKAHYANKLDFRTLSGKMKIDYQDKDAAQSFNVSLRIEKDKAIWISATLGIVKAYITPERVSFYNRLENSYFDGDFAYLSNLLGTELDFEKVQNLLLGQALFDLRKDKYDAAVVNNNYELTPKKTLLLFTTLFQIEPKHYQIKSQQIAQPEKGRLLEIVYKKYEEIEKKMFPNEITISATLEGEKSNIDVEYKNIEFNRNLKFPYDIPKDFKELILN